MSQEHKKSFVTHVGDNQVSGIPVTVAPWPAFAPSQKPSIHSPYRTVLWFHRPVNNGVRILIEGREQAAVDAYAKIISDRLAQP